ncbi:MAG: AbrB/MazE/SpoVT family DNA-binding domain-containing protein [Candidatus Bathyarchaeales archaeon]
MSKCPECGKTLKLEKREISPGVYSNVEVCPTCEEEWLDEKEYEELRALFKRKVFRVGGSLAIRLPKEIADSVGIHDGDNLKISKKDHKIIIETTS